ncbi:MAG: hypothetical protein JWN67_1989 [Actinomycetia bacterium]|nr:hypothetical protein [Actinomycetes bacterium]
MSATSRPRRTKKIVAATVGLAVVFAGVAFAYFSSQESYASTVKGGELEVTATGLPLEFADQELYPTSATDPDTAIVDSFTIANDNPVTAGYSIFAADKSASGSDGAAQFQNLYIKITSTSTTTTSTQVVPGQSTPLDQESTGPGETHIYYSGRLADLDEAHAALLGTLASGGDRTYDVAVWLADTDTVQPQGVPTDFDLTLRARTPGTSSTTSTTQP